MGEDHHAPHLGRVAAPGQEPLEVVGGLVELDARRAPHPVRDHPLLDQVPVPVVLVGPPPVAVDVHGGVEVLDLDREQPPRAEEQVVDLPAPVAVAAQQGPGVVEAAAELGRYQLLAGDTGHDLLFQIGEACAGGGDRRAGDAAFLPPGGHGQREPGPPAVPGAGPVPSDLRRLDPGAVPDQLVLVHGQHAPLGGLAAARGVAEHVAGMVGQLDDPHPPTMDRKWPPCQEPRGRGPPAGRARTCERRGRDDPVPAAGGYRYLVLAA